MSKTLVIASMNIAGHGTAVSLLQDDGGDPLDFSVLADSDSEVPVGSIFVGKIEKLDRKTNGAFVRICGGRMVFLPIRKNQTCRDFCMITKRPPEAQPHAGDALLVQIDGEAVKTKLPHARAELNLSGHYLALTTGVPSLHFSSKLSAEEKERIRLELAAEDEPAPLYCTIVRTGAAGASGSEIRAEYNELCKKLEQITTVGRTRIPGTCLYRPFPWQHLLERLQHQDLIETDLPGVRERAENSGIRCVCHDPAPEDGMSLYRKYRIPALLDRLTSRRVWMKSGATLIIDQTEAFVAIDVNSGRFSKNVTHEEMARRLNFEAAKTAMEQIRLRSLTGTILIDFLNMNQEHEAELLAYLEELAAKDPVKTVAVDITKLGIAELTRERTRLSLAEQLRRLKSED
ncbi:MAG: ribonuclease E/G [Lachnospiraceae bacterium]|nr:ribonuclease E/G [Lachnospiraceae bacterium]MCI1328973.1 ribonuclease E/G [Lachnospiraceae bacterium]